MGKGPGRTPRCLRCDWGIGKAREAHFLRDDLMKPDFSTKVTGGSFIAAGLMLLLGWILLPTHIGTYFQPQDFAAVHAQWSFWIWMYRIHIFGMVVTTMALVALGALLSESAARILVWPGVFRIGFCGPGAGSPEVEDAAGMDHVDSTQHRVADQMLIRGNRSAF